MKKREFEAYYAKYKDVITGIARKLGGSDDDLVADLEQEGAIVLWKLNPTNAVKNRDAWIRQAVKFRMVDFLRRNEPRMYESLDARLASGDQLEMDEETGELILRGNPIIPVKLYDETQYEAREENFE